MTVPAYTGANLSTGNGVTTVFPYNFKILDQTHVEVKVDGVLKVLGADYTVSGVGASGGGNVTMLAAPAVGTLVQRARVVPYVRSTIDYQYNGDLKAESVNTDLDLEEMQVQQTAEVLTRTVRAPAADGVTLNELPALAARASKYMAFDAGGQPVASSGAAATVPPESLIQVVDTIAQLKALALPGAPVTYLVRGYAARGDGGGGMYFWNSTDVSADNGGTIIQLNAGGVGRWNRL